MVVNNYYQIGIASHYIIVDDLNKMSKFFIDFILKKFKIDVDNVYNVNYSNYVQVINSKLSKYLEKNIEEQNECDEKFALMIDLSKSLGNRTEEYLKILKTKLPSGILTINYVSNYDDSKKIQQNLELMKSPNNMIMFMRYTNPTLIGRYLKENLYVEINKKNFNILEKIVQNNVEDVDFIIEKINECEGEVTLDYIKETIGVDKVYNFDVLIKNIIFSSGYDKINKQTLALEEKKNLEVVCCCEFLLERYSVETLKKILITEFERLIQLKILQNKGLISLENLYEDLKSIKEEEMPKELLNLNHKFIRNKLKYLENIDLAELSYILALIYKISNNQFSFIVNITYICNRRNWDNDKAIIKYLLEQKK